VQTTVKSHSVRALSAQVLAVILALCAAAYTASAALLPSPLTFKAGIAGPTDSVLSWYMARAAGLYTAQGMWVDILDMNGGSRGAEELQAGQIDIMNVGLSSVVHVNRSGGNLRVIGALANVMPFAFFAAPGVKSAAELKGATVGVSAFGSESDTAVTLVLQRLGLTRDDVVIKEYGGTAHRLAALKSGEIKATPLDEPTASLARQDGMNVLLDLAPEQLPWLFAAIVVRHDDIAARRDLLKRFLRATIEGNYIALADDTRAKQVLAKELKITNSKILDSTYGDFKARSPQNLEPSVQSAQNVLKLFPGVSQNVGDYVDTSLIDALRNDGFFTAVATKYGK
jgi:ABC-type nitrate/sulfonate/bicarbonate transport system substrate-binding protein